jgi:hypothetical protein
MKTPAWYVFKDFLDLTAPKEKQELLKFLTEDEKEELSKTPLLPFHPSQGFSSYQEKLHDIHYSWFISYLTSLGDSDKYLFIAPLSAEQQTPLYQHFDLSRPLHSLSSLGIDFLSQTLFLAILQEDHLVLPKECLPEDPLNALLSISRERLLSLVDFLSVHDLSLEMKTMINASHMMKIEAILSPMQKEYLHELKKTIEPISFKPIGLQHWNGDEATLKKILHQRGLNRLSKALSQSNHSLLWYLSHKLDIGRASIVKTLFKDLKNKKAQTILVAQVCNLINKV